MEQSDKFYAVFLAILYGGYIAIMIEYLKSFKLINEAYRNKKSKNFSNSYNAKIGANIFPDKFLNFVKIVDFIFLIVLFAFSVTFSCFLTYYLVKSDITKAEVIISGSISMVSMIFGWVVLLNEDTFFDWKIELLRD